MTRESEPNSVARLADAILNGDAEPVRALFEARDVPPPAIVWAPGVGDLSSKPLDFLIGFWCERKGQQDCPSEEAIDPVDLRPALGSLLVCEPTENLDDFRIRLYGSKLALEMGRDLTGSYISEVQPDSHITTFYLACYRAVALRRAPLFTRHEPSLQSFASEIKRLLLPFGQDGKVSRVLAGVDSVVRRPLGRPAWTRNL